MKDIEINSDKYTVVGVVFFLALMLVELISDLYALANHHPASADIHFLDYAVAVVIVYVAVVVCRDSKLRTNYLAPSPTTLRERDCPRE